MSIHKRLADIQSKLVAPKGQTNTFGKYQYRSCEDIVEAVKPLLDGLSLTTDDEVVLIGDRYYIKATASIRDGKEVVTATAYAREPDEKKGMDLAQLSGATSSYSRKYALNGLFAIDDTKDADTLDNRKQASVSVITKSQVTALKGLIKKTETDTAKLLAWIGAPSLEEITTDQQPKISAALRKKMAEKQAEVA